MTKAIRYAVLWQDDLRTIPELSAMTGLGISALYKRVHAGILNAAWLDEYMRKKALRERARELGVDSNLIAKRREKFGECDAIYTEPKHGWAQKAQLVMFRGELRTILEISRITGLSKNALSMRLLRGHDLDAPKMTRQEGGAVRHRKGRAA